MPLLGIATSSYGMGACIVLEGIPIERHLAKFPRNAFGWKGLFNHQASALVTLTKGK